LYYISFYITIKIEKSYRRYIIMAYKITDDCISCGACAGECPVGAISEGAAHFEIDADACLDCGACEATCPTNAIEA
jgi:NAD-dependent dihydropyrimidine dehydrogenase PreA subunit